MRHWLTFAMLFMAAALAGCGGTTPPLPTEVASPTPTAPTETPTPTRTPFPTATPTPVPPRTEAADPTQQAFVRFVHAAASLGTVDFFVDEFSFASFMEPGSFTDDSGLAAGQYRLTARPNGAAHVATILAEAPLVLAGGSTVVVILSDNGGAPALTLLALDPSPIEGERSRVTLFNALSAQPVSLNHGAIPLVPEAAPAAASSTAIVAAGALELNVRDGGQIVFANNFSLRPRQNILFIPYTLTTPDETRLLMVTSPLFGVARVAVVNTAASVRLDVLANEQIIADALLYRTSSKPLSVAARDYRIRLFEAGADRAVVPPLLETNLSLDNDRLTYLVITGAADALRVAAHEVDPAPLPPDTARLAFLNTLPDLSRARVASNVLIDEIVPYGQPVAGTMVPAGPLPLAWTNAQTGAAIELRADFAVAPGTDVLFLLMGTPEEPAYTIVTTVGEAAPTPDARQPTATPIAAPVVYALNPLDDLSIEFRVNDVPLALLQPRTASIPSLVTTGEVVFTALRPDTNQLLARNVLTLETGTLTLVTLLRRPDRIDLIAMTTPAQAVREPTLRLLNLSDEASGMGLAIAVDTGNTPPFPDPNATPDAETGRLDFRISYPIGLTRLLADVEQNVGSRIVAVRQGAGTYNLWVTDDYTDTISNVLIGVTLEAGRHYDVVAFGAPASEAVIAFVVPRPAP